MTTKHFAAALAEQSASAATCATTDTNITPRAEERGDQVEPD
jgi:hypothetical protein